ncbi:MAG: inositol monophosphatase family protein, partial [Rhodoblastus sp.]
MSEPKTPRTDAERDLFAQTFARIAIDAGRTIMEIYASGCPARQKADSSPVTAADECAEALILERLGADFPDLPVVAEESTAHGITPTCGACFILVDP